MSGLAPVSVGFVPVGITNVDQALSESSLLPRILPTQNHSMHDSSKWRRQYLGFLRETLGTAQKTHPTRADKRLKGRHAGTSPRKLPGAALTRATTPCRELQITLSRSSLNSSKYDRNAD